MCILKASANPDSGSLSLNDVVDPKHFEAYNKDRTGFMSSNGLESVAFTVTGLEVSIML